MGNQTSCCVVPRDPGEAAAAGTESIGQVSTDESLNQEPGASKPEEQTAAIGEEASEAAAKAEEPEKEVVKESEQEKEEVAKEEVAPVAKEEEVAKAEVAKAKPKAKAKASAQEAASAATGTEATETEDTPDMSQLKHDLELTIVSAKGLRDADWAPGTGKSDPYCVCTVSGKEVARTPTISDQLNPVWNMKMQLSAISSTEILEFKIFDDDVGVDEPLGRIELPVAKALPSGFQGELKLKETSLTAKAVNSFLTVKVSILKSSAPGKTSSAADKSKSKAKSKSKDKKESKESKAKEEAPKQLGKQKTMTEEEAPKEEGLVIDVAAREAAWAAMSKKQKDSLMKKIHNAAFDGDLGGVEAALKEGCDVNVQNDDPNSAGEAALHFATAKGHVDIVKLLMQYKANPAVKAKFGEWGFTPLHYAARSGNVELVELVYDPKAMGVDNYSKKSPKDLAKKEGHDAVVKLLKKLGKK